MDYVKQALLYPLPFLVVLTVLVFVHEFGHFWVARRCGVKIDTFSIGFGKELFGWKDRRGTRWKFSMLPLGGYVKMFGDEDGTSWTESPDTSHMSDADKKQLFANKPLWARAAVVIAGPMANFIFTIVVFSVMFATVGEHFIAPTAQEILPDTPAAQAGVKPGDVFVSINGTHIDQFEDIARIVQSHADQALAVVVRNGGVERALTVTPRAVPDPAKPDKPSHDVRIGIRHSDPPELVKRPPVQAIGHAFIQTGQMIGGTLVAIWEMINGTRPSDQVGGVLAIGQMSHESAKGGAADLIYFMAILSINLGLLNLFPIPILDGGHLLFYGIEAIKGSPPGEAVMKYSFRFGLAVVLMLAVFANWNDLVHLGILDLVHGHPS